MSVFAGRDETRCERYAVSPTSTMRRPLCGRGSLRDPTSGLQPVQRRTGGDRSEKPIGRLDQITSRSDQAASCGGCRHFPASSLSPCERRASASARMRWTPDARVSDQRWTHRPHLLRRVASHWRRRGTIKQPVGQDVLRRGTVSRVIPKPGWGRSRTRNDGPFTMRVPGRSGGSRTGAVPSLFPVKSSSFTVWSCNAWMYATQSFRSGLVTLPLLNPTSLCEYRAPLPV